MARLVFILVLQLETKLLLLLQIPLLRGTPVSINRLAHQAISVLSMQLIIDTKGAISGSPCTAVRWVPNSSTLFLASHADGTIIIYDVEREDGTFTPQDPNTYVSSGSSTALNPGQSSSEAAHEWDPLDSIFVTMPPWHPAASAPTNTPKPGKAEAAKNPVSHWRLSRRSILGAFAPLIE